jgi:sec-independent protein translocase protein TatA
LTSTQGWPILHFMGLGVSELLIILVIVLVIFGASRLPQIGKGLGEGIKNFKAGLREPPAEIDVTPKPNANDNKRQEDPGAH